MREYKIKKNWVLLFLCLPVLATAILCDVVMTRQAMNTGDPTWRILVAIYLISFLLVGALVWEFLAELLTRYTPDGVERPTLLGVKSIKWNEITLVKGYSHRVLLNYLEMRGGGKKIRINTLYYRDIDELVKLIGSQAPSAKWE
jgi:hypothetical protein